MRTASDLLCGVVFGVCLIGCPSAPAPRPQPTPEPEPAPAPWEAPIRGGIELSVSPEGQVLLEGRRVERLRMVLLDMTSNERKQDAAVRIEISAQAPWRVAHAVMRDCAGAGLRNLHWQLTADPRPPAYWPLPARKPRAGRRKSIVRVVWDGAQASYLWRGVPPLTGSGPEDTEPHLARAGVIAKVRAHRSRRVILVFPPDLPFEVAYETGAAMRTTGVSLEFAQAAQ